VRVGHWALRPEELNHLADRTAWSASVAVFVSGVIAALQVGKVAVALPVLQADFDLDLAAAGWIGAIFAVLGAATGSLAGVAVGRFGDRRTFLAGMLTLAAGSALGSLAHDFPTRSGGRSAFISAPADESDYRKNSDRGSITMRIDLHAHLWTDEYLDLLQAFGKEDTSAQRGKGAGLGDGEIAARFR
jgi:hypothetical protein